MQAAEKIMSTARANPVYFKLVIIATSPATEIWLGDDAGYLVQQEVGELRTSLLPGDYVGEFGLGSSAYPIHLAQARRYTQTELEAGPTCSRPIPQLPPE
jgi:hypothetical protein